MGITHKTFEEGLKVEREHKATYEWLSQYLKKYKGLPEDTDFFLHIVHDHLKENPDYYTKLKEAKL
jgi:hypothetical protein